MSLTINDVCCVGRGVGLCFCFFACAAVDLSCGNGFLDCDEQCHDNNVDVFDGCSQCQLDLFSFVKEHGDPSNFSNARGFMVNLFFQSFLSPNNVATCALLLFHLSMHYICTVTHRAYIATGEYGHATDYQCF